MDLTQLENQIRQADKAGATSEEMKKLTDYYLQLKSQQQGIKQPETPSVTEDTTTGGGIIDNYLNPAGYAEDINKLSGVWQNTEKRLNSINNIRAESPEEYAARLKQERLFGLGTDVKPEDLAGGVIPKDLKTVGKIAANVPISAVNLAKNVGGFLWNLNFHPFETTTSVLADPVGFAEGILPDWLKLSLSGIASGFVDASKGDFKGAGKDLQDAAQKSVLAFYNDPVGNVVTTRFAKKLASEGVGEFSKPGVDGKPGTGSSGAAGMVEDFTTSLNKPVQVVKDLATNVKNKGVGEGIKTTAVDLVQPITKSISSAVDSVGTFGKMFTREGRAKVAGAQANDLITLAQSKFDVENYQEKLKSLDINSAEASALQVKIEQAKSEAAQAQQNLDSLSYKIVNKTRDLFNENSFKSPSEFSNNLNSSIDTMFSEKDARYQSALNKPDGSPIQIDNISVFTDALRAKADLLGQKGQGKVVSEKTRNFADALDLRMEIQNAGGVEGYINKRVQEEIQSDPNFGKMGNATLPRDVINEKMNEMKRKVMDELASKISKSEQDKTFFVKPMTAHDLQQTASSFFNYKIPDSNTALNFFLNSKDATYGTPVKSKLDEVMKSNLERENPEGYRYKEQADRKNVELDGLRSVFKDDNGNVKTFETQQKMIDYSVTHWKELKKVPSVLNDMQNTIMSKILGDAIDETTGTINYKEINSGLDKYGEYLRTDQKQMLKEASLFPKLGEVVLSDKEMSNSFREMLGMKKDITKTEEGIVALEEQVKNINYKKDIVGTDPESIVTNIEKIRSEKDLNSFMEASGITNPADIGRIYRQAIFENNKLENGQMTIEGLVSTLETIINYGEKSKTYSKELQNKIIGEGEKGKYETMLKTAEEVIKLSKTIDKTQHGAFTALRLTISGIMAYMGFSLSATRIAFQALKDNMPPSKTGSSEQLSESKIREMITQKVPKSQRSWFSRAILPALGTGEAKKTTDKIDAYLKSAEAVAGHPLSLEERQALMEQYMNEGGAE